MNGYLIGNFLCTHGYLIAYLTSIHHKNKYIKRRRYPG